MDEPRATQLASLLRDIEELRLEKAEYQKNWKERLDAKIGQAARLRNDILTGQMSIEDAIEEEITS